MPEKTQRKVAKFYSRKGKSIKGEKQEMSTISTMRQGSRQIASKDAEPDGATQNDGNDNVNWQSSNGPRKGERSKDKNKQDLDDVDFIEDRYR
jgi:hypothetical protein